MADNAPEPEGSLSARQRRRLTRKPGDRAIVATLAFTGLIAASMQTLVIPVIPELPRLLGSTSADASWVLTSTLLAAAICTPVTGRLGDMYGKRRLALALLMILFLGSVVSGLSNSLIPLIIGRVLQGVGLGVIALGISILRDVVHPHRLASAVALVSATMGVGGAVGLPISAVIAQNLDWHYLFWLAALLALIAIVLMFVVVPVSTLRTAGRFDYVGALGLGLGLTGLLLPISKAGQWGWASPLTIGVLAGGVVTLVLWGLFELWIPYPLIDLRVAARRSVLLTNLASISVGFTYLVTAAALPQLLEAPTSTGVGLGQSLLVSSLCLTPNGLVMFFMSPVAARLSTARGPRTSLLLGGVIIAAGYVVAIFLMSDVWHAILIATVTGFGIGFAYAAMPTLIMAAVPASETAAANSLNSVMRTLGSTVAAAAVGTILSSGVIVADGIGIPSRSAFQWCFILAAAVALAGVALTMVLPRRQDRYDTASIPVQR